MHFTGWALGVNIACLLWIESGLGAFTSIIAFNRVNGLVNLEWPCIKSDNWGKAIGLGGRMLWSNVKIPLNPSREIDFNSVGEMFDTLDPEYFDPSYSPDLIPIMEKRPVSTLELKRNSSWTAMEPAELAGLQVNSPESSPTGYVASLLHFVRRTVGLRGNIVELGVAKGRNSILFGNILQKEKCNKKYFGFDTFFGYTEEDIRTAPNSEILAKIKASGRWNGSKIQVENMLAEAGHKNRCQLIEGDLKETLPQFFRTHPNEIISLLYVDCNAYLAALTGMRVAWERLVPGGIVCIDEHRVGGETKAILEFAKEKSLKVFFRR